MKKFTFERYCFRVYIYIQWSNGYKAGYEFLKRETWKNTRDPLFLACDTSTKMEEGGR